ncbi:MAG: ATP-binding protein [Gammaproteobacteria bacterium]|nr:ATP-binding protein [Gammaproteobacteria bacterium]
MKNQFYKLYILLILAAILSIYSFNYLYSTFESEQYYLTASEIFSSYQGELPVAEQNSQQLLKSSTVPVEVFPTDIQQKLRLGEVVAFQSADKTYYYRLSQHHGLLELGPITEMPAVHSEQVWIIILFYLVLGILFVALLKPVFVDLEKLQKHAREFSHKPQIIDSNISHQSSIYPLAQTFNKMSRQIIDFIELHKDLSRTIAHEVRTPLSRMKFVCEAIEKKIDKKHSKQLVADIAEIENLLEDYLQFARIESQEQIFIKSRQPVKDWLLQVIEKNQQHQDRIKIDSDCVNKTVYYQPKLLETALQNLLVNAFQFAQSRIQVSFEIKSNHCILSVSDDGEGIGSEDLATADDSLFKIFKRRKSAEKYKGFGLGLYIVRNIAIWHGGEVKASNCKILGGAKFTLIWPNVA